jgi:antirestriction protein ArdC
VERIQDGPELAKISNIVADALEEGQIPWRIHHLPRSVSTGKVFAGVNPILLQIAARRLNCSSRFWGSASDWLSVGSKVLQPQQAVHVFRDDPSAQEAVFNWEQTDLAFTPPAMTYGPAADVLDQIIDRAGIKVHYHFGTKCVYLPGEDCIKMPDKLMFVLGPGGEPGFMDALAHEAFHWSESRVGWRASYELSELRAEVGAGYLLAALGVRPLPLHLARHHRQFAPVWSMMLRIQPSLLFKIVADVCATVDWLLGLASTSILWKEVCHVREGSPQVTNL